MSKAKRRKKGAKFVVPPPKSSEKLKLPRELKPAYLDHYPAFGFGHYWCDSKDWSFRCLRDVKEFALFFKNLKRMSKLSWGQIQQTRGFNAHSVRWELKTLPSQVRQLPEMLKAYPLFQFKAFKECRIIGFFDSNCILEILFVDRDHRVYPRDG